MNEPITIDEEFRSLIPPLSEDEFKQLEENCKKDGILDSLKTWRGILIDGHNRYRIAEDNDLNYRTEEIDLPDRDAVKAWIANNQLGRRNISDLEKIRLARIAKSEIEREAEKRTAEGNAKGGAKSPTKSWETSDKPTRSERRQNETTYKLAKAAGVGEDKFRKGEAILDSGNQEIIDAVNSGEISINNGYQQIMRERTPEPPKRSSLAHEAKQRHAEFEEKKAEGVVNIQDVRQDKEDQKQIARELYRDLMSLTTKGYWIGALNNSFSFGLLRDVVTDKDRMRDRIQKLMIVLEKTLEVLS